MRNLLASVTFEGQFVSMDLNPHWSTLEVLVCSAKCFVNAAVWFLDQRCCLCPAVSAGSLSKCRIGHVNEL